MYLIVGLGNPGKKYEKTRHNVGFLAIDELAKKLNIDIKKERNSALIGQGKYGEEKILLAKPQTFMNLSGKSVLGLLSYFKIKPSHLIVVFDDLALPVGTMKLKAKGSSGGHNGIQHIIEMLGRQDFARIKIGIHSELKKDAADFVLSKFSKEEKPIIKEKVEQAVEAVVAIIENGIEKAMSRLNTSPIPSPSPKGEGDKPKSPFRGI